MDKFLVGTCINICIASLKLQWIKVQEMSSISDKGFEFKANLKALLERQGVAWTCIICAASDVTRQLKT
jgi:hypothetical protein